MPLLRRARATNFGVALSSMTLEEKLQRTAGWAALLVGLSGLVALAGTASGIDLLRPVRLGDGPMKTDTALCVAFAGAALWLQRRGPSLGGTISAAGVAALAGLHLLEERLGHSFGFDRLLWTDRLNHVTTHPTHISTHTAFALLFVGVTLLSLRQQRRRQRWPVSTWLAAVMVACSLAAFFSFALREATGLARPLQISSHVSTVLLLLGFGTVFARPGDQPVRTLFAPDSAGSLGRRLFFGVAIMPATLCLVLASLVHFRVIDLTSGALLLPLAIILSGFLVALISVEQAAALESQRHQSEAHRELLTAQLQEQAAQLQDTVGIRTRELNDANASLRAAAELNARLALVAHHTTNGVVISDPEGRMQWVNSSFERLNGYTITEILGQQPCAVLGGPLTDQATITRVIEAHQRGEPLQVELLLYTKAGRQMWATLDLQPVRDKRGKVINFIGIQTDITAQRAATNRLRELNERLALATRSAELGVWEWDAATEKSNWDDRTLAIYGLRREEHTGTDEEWHERLHPEDRARVVEAVAEVLERGTEFNLEFRIVRASDEAVRHIQSRAIVTRTPDGRVQRMTGTERDVTIEREAVHRTDALNERLRLALRSSRFGVWELDAETNRLSWDDRMFEIYEFTREEFDGSRDVWRACVHPDDFAKIQTLTRQVLAGELPAYDTEFRFTRRDGSVRFIEAHAYLQRDATGRALRFVGLNRDITGEKKMDEALTLAEQRLQLAVEGSNDSIWDWDLETGVLFHDARWALMLGYLPAEISPTIEGWRALAHPEDLAANERIQTEHFLMRRPFYQHELRMRTKTGEWKWILDRGKVVRRAPDGRPLRMAGTHSDVTIRRQLEDRLRRTEELAEEVSRLARIGGWEYDYETAQVFWSDGMRRIHDVDDSFQPTTADAFTFYSAETQDVMRAAVAVATTHGTPIDLELPLTTAQGRAIWVRVLGQAEIVNGRTVRLHGAMQDITAQHESETARRDLESQLFQVQKMETLGTLAGGIAHDFNNLLTGIIGYHELAADSLPPDHPARTSLTEARNASLRARELIEQILTFGRQSTDAGHVPLDLAVVSEEVRRLLRATLPASIALDFHLAPNCPPVLGDATQIHQVLLNLASNAAHAMRQKGGTLTVTIDAAEPTPELAQLFGGAVSNSYVHIAVRDTGHGMDDATRRRIFDPFFTTKNAREGTGLGLAVVHGIVRAHRGAIDVESAPGAGATFHIYLPVTSSDEMQPEIDQIVAPRGAGENVCVVDDEEVVGSCTKLVLENRGYNVHVFTSGEHCLEHVLADPGSCALLVTDQTMPGMQGTDLVAAMRRLNPSLPVIIMSGYFSKISPQQLDELGQVDLLAKPFTTDELLTTIHRCLHPEPSAS